MSEPKMSAYLARHMDILEAFCEKENLSLRSILGQPKGIGEDYIVIYHHNPQQGMRGLLDETPMDILMWMWKDDKDIFRFEVTDLGRERLMNGKR